jgi:hypothetical protein
MYAHWWFDQMPILYRVDYPNATEFLQREYTAALPDFGRFSRANDEI